MRVDAIATMIGVHLFIIGSGIMSSVSAQTVQPLGPGGPASPAGTTGGGWAWLWIVFVLIVVGAAIWYGTRRRRR